MRYFKFTNVDKSRYLALKEQFKTLTNDEKRMVRREKRWRNLALFATLFLFFLCAAASICLLILIPVPDGFFLEIVDIVGKVILGCILFFLSITLTASLSTPLWNKVDSIRLPSLKKEFFSNACKPLRDHYQLQAPYIVTKCFDATDGKFKNHDVCIFIVGDELRITVDLVRGFLHSERDLGCYAFKRDEIILTKQQNEKRLLLKLESGNSVFLLGYRAKGFIEKNFMSQTTA